MLLYLSNNYQKVNNNQVKFNGITKTLRKKIFADGKKDIMGKLENRGDKNTYAGELPPFWFQAIDTNKREETIKKIYKIFDEVSSEIRDFSPSISTTSSKEYKERRPETAVNKLKDMFVDLNLLKKDDYFDVKYLGAGDYKRSFKLDGVKDKNGEEYCLKVFHLVDKTPEWHKYKTHGNYAEINTGIYYKNQVGQETQHGKFYFGNIDGGYFIDKFIDKNVKMPKKIINEYDYGIKETDAVQVGNGHNVLYGYKIDLGGNRVVNKLKNENKIARYVLKIIKTTKPEYREQIWHKINASKNLQKSEKQAGLALCIKHLPNKEKYVKDCLAFNNPKADRGIAYALKYLTEEQSKKYFEILIKKQDPETQIVLLNEIPLLARDPYASAIELKTIEQRRNIVHLGNENCVKFDDLDVPKKEIRSDILFDMYKIAEKYVTPEAEEHLASYIHLLPAKEMMLAAERLIQKRNPKITDRILHKIKYVKIEEYPFSDKMNILNLIKKYPVENEFVNKKTDNIRIDVIRSQCDDD